MTITRKKGPSEARREGRSLQVKERVERGREQRVEDPEEKERLWHMLQRGG